MSGKTLTAKVTLDTSSAESKLKNLADKINSINKAVNGKQGKGALEKQTERAILQQEKLRQATLKTQLAEEKVTTQKHKSELAAQRVTDATNKTATSANKLSTAFKNSNTHASQLLTTVKRLASTYLGVMGMKAMLGASDTITSTQNRLNTMEGGSPEATSESMDKIYAASQRSRSSYTGMLSNVSKTMTLAGGSFQNDIDNAIRFQEIMAKAYTVGGASAAEQSSSMYQLVQALGSGVLQGDELRSLREGAPLAYKAIEEFAQGVFETEESLKDLASTGVITSDIVVAAIMDANFAERLEEQFENTKMTFGQAWDKVKNMAVKAFEPVLEMLNETLNSPGGQAIIVGIGNALVWTAEKVMWLTGVLNTFFSWVAENWDWLKYIVIGVLGAIGAYYAYSMGVAIANAVMWAIAIAIANWQMLLILATIGLLVAGIVWLANVTANGVQFIVFAIMAIAVTVMLIGVITQSTTLMVIGVIILVVALIVALLATCGEEVMAIIFAVGAFIYNIAVGLVNTILQVCFAFVEPFLGIIEWILNACEGGFNGFGGAVANLIGQVISWFLTLGKVVTTIIDAIFGTDWTDELTSLQDKVTKWGKKENATTFSRDYSLEAFSEGEVKNTIKYGDAINNGAEFGAGLEKGISSFGNKLKDKISGVGDFSGLVSDGKVKGIPDPYDPSLSLNGGYDLSNIEDDISEGLNKLGNIESNMDLENDDLEYLRKIAEMEWRNEFTTAEIKVDMTNNNTVSSEQDLDGIVEYLSDVLRSEMTNVAYGTHY